MGKENAVSRPFTRAFASALRASTTQNQQRVNTKRPASEDKNITASPSKKKKKKRAVLGDISSISLNASARLEGKNIKQVQVKKESSVTSEVTDLQSSTNAKPAGVSMTNDTTEKWSLRLPPRPLERSASTVGRSGVIGSSTSLDIPKVVINIDSDEKDPLLCCLYAPEIYFNLRVSELKRRLYGEDTEGCHSVHAWHSC